MCVGPIARLKHWGPITALGIIKVVTGMTVHCGTILWPPNTGQGLLLTASFLILSGLTLYNFLSAVFHGPGHLPLKWEPKDESVKQFLQFCAVCKGFKAPRSHHCQKCGRCIIKMDHHCPWINNCVGWGNQAHFTYFLMFAVIGCMQATCILTCSLYKALYYNWYRYYTPEAPRIYFSATGLITCVTALGLAIGIVVAVGMLLFLQVRGILRNRTGIEDWILDKAIRRRVNSKEKFTYPYNLGWWRNTKQVLNFSGSPIGNGVHWEVVDGCDQYTLTKEQLLQKAEKRKRTKLYHIIRAASGAWVPICQGFRVFLTLPCSDEPRIKLAVGDQVMVTRWNKHWLFGELVRKDIREGETAPRTRGWFPRRCAVQTVEEDSDMSRKKK